MYLFKIEIMNALAVCEVCQLAKTKDHREQYNQYKQHNSIQEKRLSENATKLIN